MNLTSSIKILSIDFISIMFSVNACHTMRFYIHVNVYSLIQILQSANSF